MKRKAFISALRKQLTFIDKDERDDIIQDYEDHISIGLQKKRKEEEIIKSLGSPKTLAKQIKANYHLKKAEKKASTKNIMRAVYTSIGLGFLNIILVLGPFLGVLGALAGLFAGSVAVTVSGLAAFATSLALLFVPAYHPVLPGVIGGLFVSIGVICLGLLFFIGNCYLTKLMYWLTVKYLKFNRNVILGKGGAK